MTNEETLGTNRPGSRPTGRTAVYRRFDAAGQLLYIGCSCNPKSRWKAHTRKPWWDDVAQCVVEWHETLERADAAERIAIKRELPKYNVLHTPLFAKLCSEVPDLSADDAATWAQTWPRGRGPASISPRSKWPKVAKGLSLPATAGSDREGPTRATPADTNAGLRSS